MATIEAGPPPSTFGLPPDRFPAWRPGQWDMVRGIAESEWVHHLLIAPTGFGKSLTYAGIAALTGWRTVILTATKSLQDQLVADFQSELGWVDVRGQSNYLCTIPDRPEADTHLALMVRKGTTVANAPCHWGHRCPLRDLGCEYHDRVRLAARSEVMVTNYDFWMHNRSKIGRVDLLVMDEAHQSPDLLADHLSFRLTADMRRYFNGRMPEGDDPQTWAEWADWGYEQVKSKVEGQTKPARALVELQFQLNRMRTVLESGEWVVERFSEGPQTGAIWFDCIDAEKFGREYLWGGVQVARTLLVSATINKMTAQGIGMEPDKVKVWEAKSGFPVERRPIWVVGGAPQVNFRMQEAHKVMWANLIDRIVGARGDRKGIIHTTSFDRARYLLSRSTHASRLLLNDSRNTKETIENFRRSSPSSGKVLISPSVTTGWDFPLEDCEYQVIAKVPFPDLRTKAAKVKAERNKEWAGYQAAQAIVQSSGRGMRSAEDQCETFIVDGNFGWWYGRNRKYTPRWWQEAVGECPMGKLPGPLPKL
jgi:ATP-dependent DNA helicase DinG